MAACVEDREFRCRGEVSPGGMGVEISPGGMGVAHKIVCPATPGKGFTRRKGSRERGRGVYMKATGCWTLNSKPRTWRHTRSHEMMLARIIWKPSESSSMRQFSCPGSSSPAGFFAWTFRFPKG